MKNREKINFRLRIIQFISALFLIGLAVPSDAALVINEVMASQTTVIQDPFGEYSDYIEIHNTGPSAVNLSNYKLINTDALGGNIWDIPNVTIPVGAHIIFWANDRNSSATLSTNFKLDAAGETVSLHQPTFALIDSVTYPTALGNESYGRFPNATGAFERMQTPTPLAANTHTNFVNNPNAGLIKINEVVTSNTTGIVDEDGGTSDWVELYNTSGSVTVNLQGLRLTDGSDHWVFPSTSMTPNSYLIVWASNKNRTVPQLHTNFELQGAGEPVSLLNVDGNTVVDNTTVPSIVPNHSYGRFPNGTGSFTEMSTTTPLATNVNIVIPPNPNASNITINEINPNNVSGLRDFQNDFSDWIELYNKGAVAVDLNGLRLADSGNVWAFPQSVILNPGQYLVVFASGKNTVNAGQFHTNFSISSTLGETVQYLNADNTLIESVAVSAGFPQDTSFGRNPNGTGAFANYAVPTPNALNQVLPPPAANPDAGLIVVNEVVSNSSSGLQDSDNTVQDWMELYNTSNTTTVNLQGLKLRDDPDGGGPLTGTTWVFGNVSMGPNTYLVVFLSGKNRIVGEQHTNFTLNGDVGETIEYLNINNAILSSISVPPALPDQTYRRLPNGTGAFGFTFAPTPGTVNSDTVTSPNPDADLITINEVSSANTTGLTDEDSTIQDWIELYNTGLIPVNLQNMKLQDAGNVWSFPNVTMNPGQYLIVFASGKNRTGATLHTNFQLNATGENVSLLNTDNSLVEQIVLPTMTTDQSFARCYNGIGIHIILSNAYVTPGIVNDCDRDNDQVFNPFDNCLVRENGPNQVFNGGGCTTSPCNGGQHDSNLDGYGDFCDADFDDTGIVSGGDFNIFRICFGKSVPYQNGPATDPTCALSDMDGSGIVSGGDFNSLRLLFGKPAGPSGLACAGTIPCF